MRYDRNDTTIFVTNISAKASEYDIGRHFDYAGRVTNVNFNVDKRFAYVQFEWMSEAVRAIESFNRTKFMDTHIFVSIHKNNRYIKNFPERIDDYEKKNDKRKIIDTETRNEKPFKKRRGECSDDANDED